MIQQWIKHIGIIAVIALFSGITFAQSGNSESIPDLAGSFTIDLESANVTQNDDGTYQLQIVTTESEVNWIMTLPEFGAGIFTPQDVIFIWAAATDLQGDAMLSNGSLLIQMHIWEPAVVVEEENGFTFTMEITEINGADNDAKRLEASLQEIGVSKLFINTDAAFTADFINAAVSRADTVRNAGSCNRMVMGFNPLVEALCN